MASDYDIKAEKARKEKFIAESAKGYQGGEHWSGDERAWFRKEFGDDAYRRVFLPDVPKGASGYAEAALNKGAQGATLGLADELKALVAAVGSPGNPSAKAQAYRGELERERNKGADIAALYPTTSGIADLAGGLATGLAGSGIKTGARVLGKAGAVAAEKIIPSELSALQNARRAAGETLKTGLKGAPQGAVAGVGYSDADFTKGEGLGAGIGGGLIGAGVSAIGAPLFGKAVTAAAKAPEAIPISLLSAISGAPKEAIREYAARGKEIRGARTVEQMRPGFLEELENVLGRGVSASKAGRKALEDSGKTISPQAYRATIENAVKTNAGNITDPEQVSGLQKMLAMSDFMEKQYPKGIPLTAVKDQVKNFWDQKIDFNGKPLSGSVDDVRREIRSRLRGGMESVVTEYGPLTEISAQQFRAVEPFRASMKSEDSIGNLLRQISKGKKANELSALDAVLDRPVSQEIKDMATREMMEKPSIQGSRRVVMGGNLGEAIGRKIGVGGVDLALPGKALGSAIGYGMDVAGRPMAAMSAELAGDISRTIGIDPRKMGQYAQKLGEAASSGPSQLMMLDAIMYAKEPEYKKLRDAQVQP